MNLTRRGFLAGAAVSVSASVARRAHSAGISELSPVSRGGWSDLGWLQGR